MFLGFRVLGLEQADFVVAGLHPEASGAAEAVGPETPSSPGTGFIRFGV